MAAHTYHTSTSFASQEQDLQHLLPQTMTSSEFSSSMASHSMPLQSTYDSQILPYADLEDLKEAEIEDRVRQPQQRSTTRMMILRLTSTRAPKHAHTQTTHRISHPCLVHIHRSPCSHCAHPLQVPQHTNDLPHRRTSQRPKRFAYTLGSQHARMANIHVLWRCGRLRAAQFHNNVLL